jgi:hypothetical protein
MQITCPCCAAKFPLDAGLNDADARRVAALMGELPPAIARLIVPYLGLFKPAKTGLNWGRTRRLLDDLTAEIKAGRVTRHGREWAAPAEAWIAALDAVLAKADVKRPLKNHNLLREIVASLAEKAEAVAERQTIDAKRRPAAHRSFEAAPRSAADRLEARMRKQWDKEIGLAPGDDAR